MVYSKDSNFTFVDYENPILGKCLSLMWGRPECCAYLNQLLSTGMYGVELNDSMIAALVALKKLHDREFHYN